MAEKTNFSSDSNTANFATFNDATAMGETAATKPTSLNLDEVSKPSSNEAQRPQHLLPPPYPLISSPRDFSPHEIPFFLNNNFNNSALPENIEQQLKKLNLGAVSEEMKQFKSNTDINNLFYNKAESSYSNTFNNNLPSDFENDILAKFSQQRFNNIPDFNPYEQPSTHNNPYNNLSENMFSKLRQQIPINDYNLNIMKHSSKQMPFGLSQDAVTKFYLNELLKNAGSTYNNTNNTHMECYSRKVFVGGLPPDSDENEITASFRQFGPLIIDWPHKAESKTTFPPKGYCFLLFQDEMSVQRLMESCMEEDGKYFWCVSSAGAKDKPARRVQIRPWCLVDSDFLMDATQPLDLRKTIFVGGVPRPLRAVELALSMDQLYGGVCYAGIDTDPELKYPKGAGRVSFSRQQSYISAISARFVQLQFGDIDKRVEVKPYVLDDQLCDECQGQKSAGKSAPYFCANVACLQYYCEVCWVQIHSRAGRESHKPLVKEGADRPKSIPPFKW